MLFFLSVTILSCNKEEIVEPASTDTEKEILFQTDGLMDVVVDTKATAVTSLSSFRVSATKGAAGSETSQWNNISFTSDGAGTPTYSGGKYWPPSDESFHFYAANTNITFAAGGSTISTSGNGTDIVYAYMASPTYGTKNTLTFNHAYARLGDVKVSAASGYTISNISITISPKTHGTFNMRTATWSSVTTGSATTIANATVGTKMNDLYLLPGDYTLAASWRATRDDYTHDYTSVTSTLNVSIEIGKINKIAITLGGAATEIQFRMSVEAWTDASRKSTDFSTSPTLPGLFSVSGTKQVQFTKGNLQAYIGGGPVNTYNYYASGWKLADYQYEYIGRAPGNTTFGIGTKVDLFGWVGASATWNTYGLCTYSNSNSEYYGLTKGEPLKSDWGECIEVIRDIGDGYRLLTSDEWYYLLRSRTNAVKKIHKATITSRTNQQIGGIMLLPDDWSMPSNCTVNSTDSYSGTGWSLSGDGSDFTNNNYDDRLGKGETNAWCDMEAAGAVFLPAAGNRNQFSIDNLGTNCAYLSSTKHATTSGLCYIFWASATELRASNTGSLQSGRSVRLVKEK